MKRLIFAIVVLTAATLACCNLPRPTPPPMTRPPAPTRGHQPAPTRGPQPAPTTAPTASPVTAPTEQAATNPPPPPTQPPPPPTQLPPPSTEPPTEELAILSFTVDAEDVPPNGKRLTFNWQTTGATSVSIWSGASHRFPQAWEVPPNGTHTVELDGTLYRNPSMALMAYDAADNHVSQSVVVEWACKYDYFFDSPPSACPRYQPTATWAAEQPFEHGRMIWLEEIQGADFTLQGIIVVIYDDGQYAWYEDTWSEGMLESDPSITPPTGLLQPIRGFGKLWRENSDVQNQLGWATAQEQGFDTLWQQQIAESIGQGNAFLRTLNGQIIQLNGWDVKTGAWQYLAP